MLLALNICPCCSITELFEYNGQLITINSMEKDLQKDCKEKHFSDGQVCPTYGSLHVIKNGKVNGKQRYLCKDYKKSFMVVISK
ncbi:MAG: transposase [Herbinix sp.]|jgi:hypothetical protein|nr:transposase [Herbinix sp.]